MDGLFHGKPYEQMDDLGGKPTIFGNIHIEKHNDVLYCHGLPFLYLIHLSNQKQANSQDKYVFAWNYF